MMYRLSPIDKLFKILSSAFPEANIEQKVPKFYSGYWWIYITLGLYNMEIKWQEDEGFAISTWGDPPPDRGRYDEKHANLEGAKKRALELLNRHNKKDVKDSAAKDLDNCKHKDDVV